MPTKKKGLSFVEQKRKEADAAEASFAKQRARIAADIRERERLARIKKQKAVEKRVKASQKKKPVTSRKPATRRTKSGGRARRSK